MNREVSAYLDTVRLLCALVVLLAHIELNWVPGVWQFFIPLGNECLAFLFVISGFVIGFVTDGREKTLQSYLVHRAARVYSVLIPCVLFGFVLDSVGKHYMTLYYMKGSWPPLDDDFDELLRALYSFTFIGETWGGDFYPGSMAPYWTLPYDVAYYLVFGAFWYLPGWWRIVVPILLAIAIGPMVMMFLPLWLLGMLTFRLSRGLALSVAAGRAIFFGTLLICLVGEAFAIHFRFHFGFGDQESPELWPFYVAGSLFAVGTFGFCYAGLSIRRYTGWACWGAGATATLYLLHFPLGRFINGLIPFTWPRGVRWTLMMVSILAISALFSEISERRKDAWRRAIEAGLARVSARLSRRKVTA